MTEHEEQQPLTRRERRLREMGETGALDLSEASGAPVEETRVATAAPAPAEAAAPSDEPEIEISPLNPDGTPRSRREMRQLREEALAAQASAAPAVEPMPVEPVPAEPEPIVVAEPVVEPEPVVEVVAPVVEAAEPVANFAPEVVVEADVVKADAVESDAVESDAAVDPQPVPEFAFVPKPIADEVPAPDFDSLISPPTEAFTVEELQEAQTAQRAEADAAEPVVEVETAPEAVEIAEAPVEAAPQATEEESKPKRRFWKRGKDADEAPAAEVPVEPTVVEETVVAVPVVEAVEAQPVAAEPIVEMVVAYPEPTAPIAADVVAEPEEAVVEEVAAADPEPKSAYSFPDIQPPEEWRSVFDDPNSRATPLPGKRSEGAGDFDDLISRAVAQEGAAGTSNTSALILPTMPDDTGGLKGPLGGTGELYLTGSIELPKSLGETGGHSALHDSIELDPIVGAEALEPQITADHGPAPVSARHAVSARIPSDAPVVAKPTKEHSKLPLVLALTGGGLLVVVVGVGIWIVNSGTFG